jgi:hypothetical protein
VLHTPIYSPISGFHDGSGLANGKSGVLVEDMNIRKRISLWLWILPQPATLRQKFCI